MNTDNLNPLIGGIIKDHTKPVKNHDVRKLKLPVVDETEASVLVQVPSVHFGQKKRIKVPKIQLKSYSSNSIEFHQKSDAIQFLSMFQR